MAKGVPFREAHHIVGEAVVEAIRQGKALEELALADLQNSARLSGMMSTRFWPCNPARISVQRKAACHRSR